MEKTARRLRRKSGGPAEYGQVLPMRGFGRISMLD